MYIIELIGVFSDWEVIKGSFKITGGWFRLILMVIVVLVIFGGFF